MSIERTNGFVCGMAVRLETEDPMFRRKDDARELLKIGDIVCGPYTADDLNVVVAMANFARSGAETSTALDVPFICVYLSFVFHSG